MSESKETNSGNEDYDLSIKEAADSLRSKLIRPLRS